MLLTAPILGLAGSLHCMGMCGPLVLAAQAKKLKAWQAGLLYHTGRSISYAALGALAGWAGTGIFSSNWQHQIGVLAGILMMVWGLAYFIPKKARLSYPPLWKKAAGFWMRKKHPLSLVGLGLVNGLLPCGLLWAALAGASMQGTWLGGLSFMGLFALSTWPAMMGISAIRDMLQPWLKKRQLLIGCWLILSGAWLVYRSQWLLPPGSEKEITECHTN